MNITYVQDKLIVMSKEVGVSAYDFDFELYFECTHPYRIEQEALCVLRIGPIVDYEAEFNEKLRMGLRLVNSPIEHIRASELEIWYPLIEELTPRTIVFDSLPSAETIESSFDWPVFLKGSRQTSSHNPELSIITSREHYNRAVKQYQEDSILHWQKPAVREFIPLMPVAGFVPRKIRPSVEFRSFWWYGECVGWGQYWYQIAPYDCVDIKEGLAVAQQAASLVQVPFLVVDFAKTRDSRWIVIECNDAQESGYARISPYKVWVEVLKRIIGQSKVPL